MNRSDSFWAGGPANIYPWNLEGCTDFGLSWKDAEVPAEEQAKENLQTSEVPVACLLIYSTWLGVTSAVIHGGYL